MSFVGPMFGATNRVDESSQCCTLQRHGNRTGKRTGHSMAHSLIQRVGDMYVDGGFPAIDNMPRPDDERR